MKMANSCPWNLTESISTNSMNSLVVIDYTNQYYYNLFREMYDALKVTRLKDVKLVWVDEAMFTFNTFSTRAWSSKN